MGWIGVITNIGQELLEQWSTGLHTLTIDGAKVGSGTTPEANMRIATALVNEEDDASIVSAVAVTGGTKFKIQVGPAASTGYTAKEIGIFAHIDSDAPVLLALHQDANGGVVVPTIAESPDFAFSLYALHAISNTGSITINIDTSAYVTTSTFNDGIDAIDLTGKIDKSTGDATLRNIKATGGIDSDGNIAVHSTVTKGTAPSGSAVYRNINIQDGQSGSTESNRLASLRSYVDTNNVSHIGIIAYKPASGSTDSAYFLIHFPAAGSATAELSCALSVDGQITCSGMQINKNTDGGITVDTSTAITPASALVTVANSLHSGFLGAFSDGNFGLYSSTLSKTLIYMDTNGTVSARNADDTARRIVGTHDDDGQRVAYLRHGSTTSVRVYGQKGSSGAGYTGYTLLTGTSDSDIRLKENIKDAEVEGLPIINGIEMKSFDWKPGHRDYRHSPIGMIADQIEELDERLIMGGGYDPDGEPNYKAIDDHYLLCYLVKAVQELSAQIAKLKGGAA